MFMPSCPLQICIMYFGKDLSDLLAYLNDGILNVFITRSYEAS